METAPLKSFATWARTALIREVSARITAVLAPASKDRIESATAIAALERDIAAEGGGEAGRDAIADKAAYTWFNRIIALRFMDANGYTGTGIVSPPGGQAAGQPEVLADAKRGNIDPAVLTNKRIIEEISALLDGNRRSDDPQGEAYALLLAEYCRHWHRSMPFMFEREGDYTELLIPANLLARDSVLARAVTVLTEEICQDVEVIGWLYQFYISERKDEVFAGFKKNKKAGAAEIPAATQLFTPHWIVRYLVENSLGRLWMMNRPTSRLVDQMEYYFAPVNVDTDFLRVKSPEEIKIADPACGSGHMLTYAFDLLYAIYEEDGYAPSDIPSLILSKNLYGIEIDPRAGALAAFALCMKARAKQRTFFAKRLEPNVCVLHPISFAVEELDFLLTPGGDSDAETAFWSQFEHADVLGSLVQPDTQLIASLGQRVADLDDGGDILRASVLDRAERLVKQAEYLRPQYTVVVANPPYMGSGNMSAPLSAMVKDAFPNEKQDLYACFVVRSDELVVEFGYVAMVTGDTWMTLTSFEALRRRLLAHHAFLSFVHMHDVSNHPDIFGANSAFVIAKGGRPNTDGTYVYLDASSSAIKAVHLRDAAHGRAPERIFFARSSQFDEVPGAPLVFRMTAVMRNVFHLGKPLVELAEPRQGLLTGDSDAFVREWWEVSRDRTFLTCVSRDSAQDSHARWFPYNKGGEFRKWYGNHEHLVNWENDGQAVRAFGTENGGKARSRPQNANYYFRQSVSWSNVSSGAPAFRAYPPGFIAAGSTGDGVYPQTEELSADLLGILNSSVTHDLLAAISPTLTFNVGTIAKLPIILPPAGSESGAVVRDLIEIARADWDQSEMSWGFVSNPLAMQGLDSLESATRVHYESSGQAASRARLLEEQNNDFAAQLYGLKGEIETKVTLSRVSLNNNARFKFGAGLSDSEYWQKFRRSVVEDLISYAVGCMFGRYSLDEQGLVLADQGATVQGFLAKVPSPTFMPDDDNVIPIVNGDWFEDGIVERFRQFLRVAFGEKNLEENLHFVTESLGVKELGDYFFKSFFKDHVQRYKKRPIYWLFSSPSGSFNALIYLHRYTPSTVSTVLNEYLREFKAKLEASRQHHERLVLGAGTPRETAAAGKEVEGLRKVLFELDEYEHDVLYPLATQQVAIDLDDGVKINYSKFGDALKKISGLETSDE